MKKIRSFNVCLLTALLILLLVSQPATIVYYTKGEERQFWELVDQSALQKGKFTDEPQEVVFVYRKKKLVKPSQIANVEYPAAIIPPARKQSSHYGELLRDVSGIFLFGSARIR